GLTFAGDSGTPQNFKLGQTVSIVGGAALANLTEGNIGVVVEGGKLNIKLSKDLVLGADGSVTTGDTVMNNDGVKVGDNVTLGDTGLIIKDGPSITAGGIDMNNKKITGLAEGKISSDSTDAINGSQLYYFNKYMSKSLMGDHGTLNSDGTIAIDFAGALGSSKPITNVYDGFKNVGDRLTANQESIDKGLTFTTDTVNESGDKVENNYKLGKTVSIIGGAHKDNLTDNNIGVNINKETNDIEVKLGKDLDLTSDGSITIGDTKLDGNGLTIAGGPSVTGKGIDAGGKVITNVADGVNAGDAVNKGQLDAVGKNVTNITNGKAGLIQLTEDGETIVVDNDIAKKAGSFDISGGPKSEDNPNGDRTLTGVKDGAINKGSSDAINGSQLYDSNTAIANLLGGGAKIDGNGNVTYGDSNFTVNGNGYKNVQDALTALDQNQIFGKGEALVYDKDGKESKVGAIVINPGHDDAKAISFANSKGVAQKVTGVADGYIGADSTEAINGSQLHVVKEDIQNINYTLNHYNTRMNNIEKTVYENRKRASAGIAGAMAMSSIPYIEYSKYSFGMGIGYYDGESAISIGIQGKINDRARYRLQMSYDTQNKVGLGAGVAFEL
ncbi:YadA-like family protein, partial [Ignatzschineria ureiclastica]